MDLTKTGWNGYFSIKDARITGDLTGTLILKADSGGTGGEITTCLTVDGDLTGSIDLSKITGALNVQAD